MSFRDKLRHFLSESTKSTATRRDELEAFAQGWAGTHYPSHRDLAAKLFLLIAESNGVPKEQILSEAHLVDDLGIDSLDNIDLALAVERIFNFTIPDEERAKIETVDDLVQYVAALR